MTAAPLPLADLVARARGGGRADLEELVRRSHPRIHALAYHMLGSAPDAEDAAQEALLRLCLRLRDLRDPERYWAWALRVAGNHFRDLLRRRAPSQLPLDEACDLPVPDQAARSAERSELRERVLQALRALSLPLRLVVVLRDAEGFSTQEVAEALDLPEGTVKSRLFEARRQLRASLGGCLD
ncbi:MAG: sigma-70 family RNA polymerase sigma factor [Candidatus Eremiobacterota bacterium]